MPLRIPHPAHPYRHTVSVDTERARVNDVCITKYSLKLNFLYVHLLFQAFLKQHRSSPHTASDPLVL